MAQKQYTTYQADILSFELRDALLGIAKPGRYRGFDTFAQYQAPSFPNVYGRITHVDGIDKYDKASPPVLEATRGVAITTQGTIIAEDGNIDLTIVVSNNASVIWHVIYMEHEYTEVQGANPATYGVRSGTPGGGIPTLTSPTSQVPLAYIEEDPLTIDMAGLTYYPAQTEGNYGDHKIAEKLWGSSVEEFLDTSAGGQPGTIPADGIIGNRNFVWGYYVTDYQSITASLNALDGGVKGNADVITTLLAYKLDDWGTPDDNTDLNATTSYHGLLPKLSGDASEFLNGLGSWEIPLAGFLFPSILSSSWHENDTLNGGSITMGSQYEWDVSSIVPAGYTQVYVAFQARCRTGANNPSGRFGSVIISEGGTGGQGFRWDGPPPYETGAIDGDREIFATGNGLVKLSGTRTLRITWGNYSGSTTDWMVSFDIKIVAYR